MAPFWLDAQEIQTAKDRSQELIDKILRRSKVILDGLLRIASLPNRDILKDIERKLKDYNEYGSPFHVSSLLHFLHSLLRKTLVVLQTYASKGLIDRIVNRASRLGNLEKYDRLINDFNTDFVVCFLYCLITCTHSSPRLSFISNLTSPVYRNTLHDHQQPLSRTNNLYFHPNNWHSPFYPGLFTINLFYHHLLISWLEGTKKSPKSLIHCWIT